MGSRIPLLVGRKRTLQVAKPVIAILGWGSLIWDNNPEFDRQHGEWQPSGSRLSLEFSRISSTRKNALTLVLDYRNGWPCTVAYALSRGLSVKDAIADLRCREDTTMNNIGVFSVDGSPGKGREPEALQLSTCGAHLNSSTRPCAAHCSLSHGSSRLQQTPGGCRDG